MDRDLLKEISAVSEFHENIFIEKYEIPLIFRGINGVYVVIDAVENKKSGAMIYGTIKQKLELMDEQLFLFSVSDDDTGEFYDYKKGVTSMDDIYDAYENCYANHLMPQSVLFHIQFENPAAYCNAVEFELECEDYEENADSYVSPVISEKQIAFIEKKLVDIINEPVLNGNYRAYPDGRVEVKKILTQSVAGFSTFVENGTAYFPCMDADGDNFFILTLLGGWFGLHKFKTGNYLTGLFYALTFGCCGVFYILDLLSIILGGYSYSMINRDNSSGMLSFKKKKFYSRPIKNKKKAVVLILAAAAATFLAINFIYLPVLKNINVYFSSIISDTHFANKLVNSYIGDLQ